MKRSLDTPEVIKQLESNFKINVHEILDLHAQIRARVPDQSASGEVARMWAELGRNSIHRSNNSSLYEAAMFMAHLYDKQSFEHIENLIDALCINGKYKQAIDFLIRLYGISEENDTRFWDCLVKLLPIGRLMVHVHSNQVDPLERFIEELDLDESNFMTWMTLGYTLKYHDFPVLSNQALDNALALKYFADD
ncbi:MAG: hypothetical protein ACXAE3_02045 [Candidatus Kariarchaeaceae archaeon]|jgi:transcription initiation factor TFIIIB Brf1 subunit/transcription initiation factor TFIIB